MPHFNYEVYLKKFEEFSSKVIERKAEFDNFVKFLKEKTNYFDAPASTIYHLNIPHGLFFHSVGVTENLLKIKNTLMPELSDESCVICGLFHDVGKAGFPGQPLYITTEKGYDHNKDIVELQIAIRSLYVISSHIRLKTDEAQAIAYHDGQYIPQGRDVAHRETPLLTILHFADFYTAHIVEDDIPIKHGDYIS
ncbi:MAG: HD domain-containing protein [Candidatus Wallbacteria bacterium]